jgi:PleD family two-component response regulator
MVGTQETAKENDMFDPIPRIALFITDAAVNMEIERILRDFYSSLLLVTDLEKLAEFELPMIVIVDTIQEISRIRGLNPASGTKVLLIANALDGEITAAAFSAGADDCLAYPFAKDELIATLERYLESYR